MQYGFQCFDAETGLLTFEVTDRLTKVIGILNPNATANFSGSVTLTAAQLKGGGIFVFPMASIKYDIDAERNQASNTFRSGVTVSDGTITCNKINYPVMYGVG